MKVAYLYRDRVETVTGEVEFSQGEDLTHTFREHTQTVVRQVQALQLRKPKQREQKAGPSFIMTSGKQMCCEDYTA